MRSLPLSIVAAGALLLMASCTAPTEDELAGPGDQRPVAQQLDEGQSFEVSPEASVLAATTGGRWSGYEARERELHIRQGHVQLGRSSDGQLRIESLELELEDFISGQGVMPPDGVHLTNLRVALERQVSTPAVWATEDAAADGSLDLTWQWALQLEDRVSPLGDGYISGLPFDVHVTRTEAGGLVLTFDVSREGLVWELPGLLELHDLELHLEAVSVD